MGYSPWAHKELDILVQLTLSLSSAVSQEKSVCVCVCVCVCVYTHPRMCTHACVCYNFVIFEFEEKNFREKVHSLVSVVKLVGC